MRWHLQVQQHCLGSSTAAAAPSSPEGEPLDPTLTPQKLPSWLLPSPAALSTASSPLETLGASFCQCPSLREDDSAKNPKAVAHPKPLKKQPGGFASQQSVNKLVTR